LLHEIEKMEAAIENKNSLSGTGRRGNGKY